MTDYSKHQGEAVAAELTASVTERERRMKAVLFDFDGVVVQSMEDHFEGWRRALEEYGIMMNPEELYVIEGAGVEEVAHQLARKFNLPMDATPSIIEKKQLYYDQIKQVRLYPNLLDLLQWAKEKELKVALVTGGGRERVLAALGECGISNQFEVIVTANDVSQTKPSPEPYLVAARLLGIDPHDCVVIENAPLGIRSARNAGMRCVAVSTTLPPAYLKEADVVTDNLNDVWLVLKRMY